MMRVRVYSLTIFTPACFLGVHLSTMNPNLARYYNKLQTQPSNRKIPEKEGVMIEKVNKGCLIFVHFLRSPLRV